MHELNVEQRRIAIRLLFRALRQDGELEVYARRNGISCRKGESTVDAMVRLGLSTDPWAAIWMIAGTAKHDYRPLALEIAQMG